MSTPGRPKGEFRSAEHEGTPVSTPGRPKGEFRSSEHEGAPVSAPRYREAHVGGCLQALVQRDADGTLRMQSTEPLLAYPERLTDCLERWAAAAPERTLAARRGADGAWRRISYSQMLSRVQCVGQSLVERGLSSGRPVAILSENDLEHLTLALACMWAGIPFAPISPAYSLVSRDFGKLRHILDTITPGLVFASGPAYASAIAAVVAPSTEVVLTQGEMVGRSVTSFDALLSGKPGAALSTAHAAVGADTIAKFLFTSGSTKLPKGVINTQRMLCANQQMVRQAMAFLADEPPVLVDWLPWNHTFGGNHNIGIVVYNGGTLYIDDGKPTPAGIAETLRNLREISPTVYFNVPKGFEAIAQAMDSDTVLRDSLFRRCKAFMFAGAGLAQAVWDKLDAHGEAAVGERVRIITGLGMTETSPACNFAVGTQTRSGHIGLPLPGVDIKLVPEGDKTEIRYKGPNVMPGYWRAPEQTAMAFDAEGYYRTGDAVRFIDEADPQRGLRFDGRIAEDFKLSTGTFVSVGPLRARIIEAGDPCVWDAVITGIDRDQVGALIIPRIDECRRIAKLVDGASADHVLHSAPVRQFFQTMLDRLAQQSTGSASHVARIALLAEPPSIDLGEVTDKGSINQRAVLTHRAALVAALYEGNAASAEVLMPRKASA